RGNVDDRSENARSRQLASKLNSRFALQVDIHNNAYDVVQLTTVAEVINGTEQFRVESMSFQDTLNSFEHAGVVIYDDDNILHLHRLSASRWTSTFTYKLCRPPRQTRREKSASGSMDRCHSQHSCGSASSQIVPGTILSKVEPNTKMPVCLQQSIPGFVSQNSESFGD